MKRSAAEATPEKEPGASRVSACIERWLELRQARRLGDYAPDDLFELEDVAGEWLVRQFRDRRIRESYVKTARLSRE